VGHLVWTTDRAVWAVWRVEPVTYRYLDTDGKRSVHSDVRAALLAAPDESALFGIAERADATQVVSAMVDRVDLGQAPAWVDASTVALDALEPVALYRRAYFLAVKLPASRGARRSPGAAATEIVDVLRRCAPRRVSADEVQRRQHQASQLEATLARYLAVRPATVDELTWLYARAPRRGLDEPLLDNERERDACRTAALAALGAAVLTEGGPRDVDRTRRPRRYLTAATGAGMSYQAFLALAGMPQQFLFPDGAEWFPAVEMLDLPVDWVARVRPVRNATAQLRARRQARQLTGQLAEYDGEPAGLPASLESAIEGITDERAELAAHPTDPELETTIVFAVWGDTRELCDERADRLRGALGVDEYDLARPFGGQLDCYRAMLVGSALPHTCRDYTQYLLPRDLAAGMPFADADVGDPRGMMLGWSLDVATPRPVLLDPAYGPETNRSGSVGIVGDLGSGKSWLLKTLAWATLARGGQVVAVDRTPRREWTAFAATAPGTVEVVRLDGAGSVTIDPLRIFRDASQVKTALGFLTLLTGASPQGLDGAALAAAVREVAADPSPQLPMVVDALRARRADPEAEAVARKLDHLLTQDLAEAVVGDAPPLRVDDVDLVVFDVPHLALPDRTVLLAEHLARRMLPEQVLSQALLYLVTAIARQITFADPGRFAALALDECWAVSTSLEGRQLLVEAARDGRKHHAAVWLASHAIDDLGDEAVRDLLRVRFLCRHTGAGARDALPFVGISPDDERAAELVRQLATGQCLFRDVSDRTGLIEVSPLGVPTESFDTGPTRATP
jgi:energy-coupling factor transporter ATP-binding protein EcfA2